MAGTCEAMRQFFRLTKMCIIITAGADSQSQQSSTYELLQNVDSEAASDTEIQDLATDDGRHPFKGPSVYFTVGIVCYHLVCADIVAVAVVNGWISTNHGGDFAWELWALWQQLCLWTLLVQNLARCVTMEARCSSIL